MKSHKEMSTLMWREKKNIFACEFFFVCDINFIQDWLNEQFFFSKSSFKIILIWDSNNTRFFDE